MFSSKNPYSFLKVLLCLTLYFFVLNLVFPLVSDDFSHLMTSEQLGGLQAAANSFMTWNARTGELLLLLLGDWLNGVTYSVFNTLIFASIFYFTYQILYVRKPVSTSEPWSILVMLTILMLGSIFGAVFLWRAGALNYALSLSLFLGHFVLVRYYVADQTTWFERASLGSVVAVSTLAFLAGMSSFDMGAVGVVIHAAFIGFIIATKREWNWRYVALSMSFVTGFLVLYFAPGTQVRAGHAANVGIGELIGWLFSAQAPDFFAYSLLNIGKSMFKTNYVVALASLVAVSCSFGMLKNAELQSYRSRLGLGYAAIIVVLLALLFVEGTMAGDALGAVILVANGILSAVIAAILVLKPTRNAHAQTLLFVSLISVLLFIDISIYVISGSPTRRAYFFATYLSALIVTMLVTTYWSNKKTLLVFAPIFSLGLFYVSLATYGLYKVEQERVILPAQSHSGTEPLIIEDYAILNTPQFYGWDFLAKGESVENSGLNNSVARYLSVPKVELKNELQELGPMEFIDYLSTLSEEK
ncbi:DUF6056 family protein [Vibrio sp. CB1-14]|uniref:DUF6056 family protein n=1 Tax=Vibrio chaetopteri TaxID=3016528 RepID=A0AAU8BSN5_9VIBR